MKYKVTITNVDATGQEDNKTLEGLDQDTLHDLVKKEDFSSILIEPMPEKKKVTVWFYFFNEFESIQIASSDNYDLIKRWHDNSNNKCSEIFSKEVEI